MNRGELKNNHCLFCR